LIFTFDDTTIRKHYAAGVEMTVMNDIYLRMEKCKTL
jgi:hypothetical protein